MGLKPQTGKSIEAGWGLIENDFSVRVDVYKLRLEDEIIFDGSAPKPIGGLFNGANVNADKSERNGVNVSGDFYATEDILLGFEYSFVDAEFTKGENDGKKLPWVARNTGRVFMTYDFDSQWQLFVEGVYTGSRYKEGDDQNISDRLSSYWLSNMAVNFTQDSWSATLRVDNALDEKYPASVASYGAYYPGDGRKVMLTTAYHF